MCLARLILREEDGETVLLDSVCTIVLDGSKLTAANLFGKTVEISGSIARIDFRDSFVLIAKSLDAD